MCPISTTPALATVPARVMQRDIRNTAGVTLHTRATLRHSPSEDGVDVRVIQGCRPAKLETTSIYHPVLAEAAADVASAVDSLARHRTGGTEPACPGQPLRSRYSRGLLPLLC